MYMKYSSAELSEYHISNIIMDLRHDAEFVTRLWAPYVPVGEYSVDEKVAFIVSALPFAADCAPHFIAMQLTIGPEFFSDLGVGVEPGVVHDWVERYPDTAHEVAELYASMRLVPEGVKSNVEWACMCAIREALAMVAENGGDAVCMAGDVETVQSAAVGWLYEAKRHKLT